MTFNSRTELRETCPACHDTPPAVFGCRRCGGWGHAYRSTHDSASSIDGNDEPERAPWGRVVSPRMVALARLLRDDANSEPLRELLEIIDGGAA